MGWHPKRAGRHGRHSSTVTIPLALQPKLHACRPLQDAEAFESKRSRGRGERGGEPAWASARVAAKRGAEEAARLQSEIDEDDAFAVSAGRHMGRACTGLGCAQGSGVPGGMDAERAGQGQLGGPQPHFVEQSRRSHAHPPLPSLSAAGHGQAGAAGGGSRAGAAGGGGGRGRGGGRGG